MPPRKTPVPKKPIAFRALLPLSAGIVLCGAVVFLVGFSNLFPVEYVRAIDDLPPQPAWPAALDQNSYNLRMLSLAHVNVASTTFALGISTTTVIATGTLPVSWSASSSVSMLGRKWPHAAAYPYGDAIFPFTRIVAYYGNFYSKQMGVLGEYPEDEVLAKLASTTAAWQAADPSTPTIPAIQYIAVVAQGSAGKDGKWRARMPDEEIEKALTMANQMHGLLILDVQVGLSTLQDELPLLEDYLKLPNVMLAIDPEFSMKYGNPPGTVIGTFDAKDINYAAGYLASIVDANKLPPKVLVVHRFTYDMVTHAENITPLPEVQVVMDMDGWGSQAKKIGTYTNVVAPEPVQFTGIKLFYHADLKAPSTGLLTMDQVLGLTPAPIYIQYQ